MPTTRRRRHQPCCLDVPLDALDGPTPGELAAIEAEWPRIARRLSALDADIAALHTLDLALPTTPRQPGAIGRRGWRRTTRETLAAAWTTSMGGLAVAT